MNFKTKIIMSIAVASIFFSGCGDEPEAPNPLSSQDDDSTSRFGKNNDDNLSGKGFQKDMYGQDLTLNKLSASDRDRSNGKNSSLDGDLDYVNTQFKSIFFEYDSYIVTDTMARDIGENIRIVKNSKASEGNMIIVEGNCDEWGTDEYNYGLGLKRAQIIKDELISEGIPASKIKTVSYGESNPICLEANDACWTKNRRVDFKLEQQ